MDGCVKLDLGNAFWRKAEEIVNISLRIVFPTLAVVGTFTGDSCVEIPGEWSDMCSEHVDNGPKTL